VQRCGVASGGQLDGVVNSMGDYVRSYEKRAENTKDSLLQRSGFG
jgi:hypothetical protein